MEFRPGWLDKGKIGARGNRQPVRPRWFAAETRQCVQRSRSCFDLSATVVESAGPLFCVVWYCLSDRKRR
jgi:hypothetical protein